MTRWRPLWERLADRAKPTENGCIEYEGSRTGNGYGSILTSQGAIGAHRASWFVHYGPIPDGMRVLHRCDNPPCIRPDHLFLGTSADNSADMIAKDRHRVMKGSKHPRAKLTEEEVVEIRQRAALGETHTHLAAVYGVSQVNITLIVNRKLWKNV